MLSPKIMYIIILFIVIVILVVIEKVVFKVPFTFRPLSFPGYKEVPFIKFFLSIILPFVLAIIVLFLCHLFNQDYSWAIGAGLIGISMGRIYLFTHFCEKI